MFVPWGFFLNLFVVCLFLSIVCFEDFVSGLFVCFLDWLVLVLQSFTVAQLSKS